MTVVSNVADGLRDEPWRSAALAREYQSAVSVPLAYDEFAYGALTVYADRPDAFDDMIRAVLAELGETIASAIAAVERKRALVADARTRLEFDVADDSFVFARLARQVDCVLSFDGGIRHHEHGTTVFATVEGASPDAVVTAADALVGVERAQVVTTGGASRGNDDGATDDAGDDADLGGAIRLDLSRPLLAQQFADHGVVLRGIERPPRALGSWSTYRDPPTREGAPSSSRRRSRTPNCAPNGPSSGRHHGTSGRNCASD